MRLPCAHVMPAVGMRAPVPKTAPKTAGERLVEAASSFVRHLRVLFDDMSYYCSRYSSCYLLSVYGVVKVLPLVVYF